MSGYTCIDNDAHLSDLSDGGVRLLLLIIYRTGQNPFCWASHASFAEDMRCSVRTVRNRQEELAAAGLITVENRGNRTNLYRLTNRQPVAEQPPTNRQDPAGLTGNQLPTEEEPKNKNQEELLVVPVPETTRVVTPCNTTSHPTKKPEEPAMKRTLEPPVREDVQRICEHLADRIEGNAGRRPPITAKWYTATRLMLDHDQYTEAQIMDLIDRSHDDKFWKTNILSMPKLRAQAIQLKMKLVPAETNVAAYPSWMYRGMA